MVNGTRVDGGYSKHDIITWYFKYDLLAGCNNVVDVLLYYHFTYFEVVSNQNK